MYNLIAIGILAYSIAGGVFHSQLGWEANPAFWVKMIGAGVTSGGFLVYTNSSFVLGYISSLAKGVSVKSTVTSISERGSGTTVYTPDDVQFFDYSALKALQKRCEEKKSVEGLELCAKLAVILFTLDVKE
jgi:hypothetical protein